MEEEEEEEEEEEIDGLYGKRWGSVGWERREIFKLRGLIRNKS